MTLYILALETSSSLCGVALLTITDGRPAVRVVEHDATAEHAERLLPMVDILLNQAGIDRTALSAVAFGQGPGGFTGLRVACGVAQGLGLALDIPVLPISSLLAAAARDVVDAPANGCPVTRVVLQDARMHEIYLAAYAAQGDDASSWHCIQDPVLVAVEDVSTWLDRAHARSPGLFRVMGDALQAYSALGDIIAARDWVQAGPCLRADAEAVALLGLQDWQAGRLTKPDDAAPVYIRDKVAFTIAERDQGAGGNPRAPALPAARSEPPAADVVLLPMHDADLDEVAEIERSVQSHPWSRNNFADGLKAGYSGWVAQSQGQTAGFSMVMLAPDVAHVLVIAVRPAEQKRGVGRLLLNRCEQVALDHGLTEVVLEVRQSNGNALHFYQSRGYRILATRKDYYPLGHGRREDALIMKKELVHSAATGDDQGKSDGVRA